MQIKYFDIHSHLDFADYGKDVKEVIKRMKDSGVATITIGTDLESSREAVRIASENENIWACIGVHPTEGVELCEDPSQIKNTFDGASFAELVKNPKVVAIGECGLEYFKLNGDIESEKNRQKKEFIKQIEFAIKYKKPLMLHIRDAYEDAYKILKNYKNVKGNLHFFAGNLEWAKKFIDLGFTLSFTGVITFLSRRSEAKADANHYDEVIKNIPLDKIHAETDSPFVAPVPYRGKRNEPTYVIEVVKKIAELRNEGFEIVRKQLLENAKGVFGI